MRPAVLLACAVLLAVIAAGCQTTQETAALRQAEAKRILDGRKHRKERKRRRDSHGRHGGEQR